MQRNATILAPHHPNQHAQHVEMAATMVREV
jgi:hypothetical protein